MTLARRMDLMRSRHETVAPSSVNRDRVYRLRGRSMVERKYVPAVIKFELWQEDAPVISDMARAIDCWCRCFHPGR
jgi:hypothetical protein